jgi:hypothetical protein
LDDSGGLSPLEEMPQVKAGEKDIFETDFDVPGLEDESGSQAVALEEADTGLDSSDFDLEIDSDAESGSVVVALDEEADDAAATVQQRGRKRPTRAVVVDEDEVAVEEDFGELDEEGAVAVEDEEEFDEEAAPARTVVKEKLLPAAPWGAGQVFVMLPCVIIMFFVTLLGFEMVQSAVTQKGPGVVTRLIGGMFDSKLK